MRQRLGQAACADNDRAAIALRLNPANPLAVFEHREPKSLSPAQNSAVPKWASSGLTTMTSS